MGAVHGMFRVTGGLPSPPAPLPVCCSWEDRLSLNLSLMRGEPLGAPTGGCHPWQAPAQAAAHGPIEPGAKAPQAEGKETVAGMGGLGPRAAVRPPRPG